MIKFLKQIWSAIIEGQELKAKMYLANRNLPRGE
jgi:hypothetical protein